MLFLRLLIEIPRVPDSVIEIIQKYCELTKLSQIGLSGLEEIVLKRPNDRILALNSILMYACHKIRSLRSQSIRIIINHLFPEESLHEHIIEYAIRILEDVMIPPTVAKPEELSDSFVEDFISNTKISLHTDPVDNNDPNVPVDTDQDNDITIKKEKIDTETNKEISQEEKLKQRKEVLLAAARKKAVNLREAAIEKYEQDKIDSHDTHIQRHVLLYFALCTKRNELFGRIVDLYIKIEHPKLKESVKNEAKELIQILGMACEDILKVIRNCPDGGEEFILLILQTLTLKKLPSDELIDAAKDLYSKKPDARFLIPILPRLNNSYLVKILPALVDLPIVSSKIAIRAIALSKNSSFKPQHLLIKLHELCPTKQDVRLKKVIDLIQLCLNEKKIFNSEVLAAVLQQLVDKTPVPVLFMRTLIQSLLIFTSLTPFAMGILSRLVSKLVWESPDL